MRTQPTILASPGAGRQLQPSSLELPPQHWQRLRREVAAQVLVRRQGVGDAKPVKSGHGQGRPREVVGRGDAQGLVHGRRGGALSSHAVGDERLRVEPRQHGRRGRRLQIVDHEDHPRVGVERAVEADAARGLRHSKRQVPPLGPVLDDETERLRASVLLHVCVEQARLAHGELVADGHVALQPRRRVLQLQDGHVHARAFDGLDQRELARHLQRLEGLREVADERLLLGVRWWWALCLQREVEVRAVRVQLACGRAEELHGRAGHGPLAQLLQPGLHQRPVVGISRLEIPQAAQGGGAQLLERPLVVDSWP
eukprot:scaffold20629_cov67-Phaeocystis_antarctica.AAC.4